MSSVIDSMFPKDASEPGRRLGLGLVCVALASSLLASACCVLPLLLVLAGITGAWMTRLTALKPVTPFFTVAAVAALIGAGYLIFVRSGACAVAEGAACDPKIRRLTRGIFVAAAIFIAALLLFPLAAPLFY